MPRSDGQLLGQNGRLVRQNLPSGSHETTLTVSIRPRCLGGASLAILLLCPSLTGLFLLKTLPNYVSTVYICLFIIIGPVSYWPFSIIDLSYHYVCTICMSLINQ